MMKYLILAAAPIVFTLSIANTVNAGIKTINIDSTNEPTARTKNYFFADNNIPKEDFRGINQAIVEYYKELNKDIDPNTGSGSMDFFEVKKIKIIEFNARRDGAIFHTEEIRRQRSFERKLVGDMQYVYNWYNELKIKPVKRRIIVVKNNGKWRVMANGNGSVGLF